MTVKKSKPADRPTCLGCGRPLKPARQWKRVVDLLTEDQRVDPTGAAWPRTTTEAAELAGWPHVSTFKRGPRPLSEWSVVNVFDASVPGMRRKTNRTEIVGVGEVEDDLVVLEITRETGAFGYEARGYFCGQRCGYLFAVAVARRLEERGAK